MKPLKPLSAVTLQEQLYQELASQMKNGTYQPGERIPSEPQLSEMYHVSRVTVRNAIAQLVKENKLVKKHGKGTFVKMPVHVEEVFSGGSFTDTCLRMHAQPSTHVLTYRHCRGEKEILEKLGVAGDRLIEITRVRYVDQIPCIVEVDYFPDEYDFLLQAELEQVSLLKLVSEKTGITPAKFEDHFQIAYAKKEFADPLRCTIGSPLLKVTQSVMSRQDQVIYVNEQYIETSRYIYVVRSAK